MPSTKCSLTINGQTIRANVGETLLDAALAGRIVLPHDCCSGQCETCRVRVIRGNVDDCGTREKQTVLGCVSTLDDDAEIAFDLVPIVRKTRGVLDAIAPLGNDIVELRIRTARPIPWLPGQYLRVTFRGYPPRDYSPTFPLDLQVEEGILVFHAKIYPAGRLSGALGKTIVSGHKVTLQGPFGNAYLRRQDEPLVLISIGTGFAPIWAIAVAARMGQPWRRVWLIAGAARTADLYMRPAVDWLRRHGVDVTLTAGDGCGREVVRQRPSHLLSGLAASEVVYAAGSPTQVDAVRKIALSRGADFYADPFFAAASARFPGSWFSTVRRRSEDAEPQPTAAL